MTGEDLAEVPVRDLAERGAITVQVELGACCRAHRFDDGALARRRLDRPRGKSAFAIGHDAGETAEYDRDVMVQPSERAAFVEVVW
jgi:hypothetical protein